MYLVTHRKVGYGHLKSIKPFFMCKIILFVKSHNAQWESPTVHPPAKRSEHSVFWKINTK